MRKTKILGFYHRTIKLSCDSSVWLLLHCCSFLVCSTCSSITNSGIPLRHSTASRRAVVYSMFSQRSEGVAGFVGFCLALIVTCCTLRLYLKMDDASPLPPVVQNVYFDILTVPSTNIEEAEPATRRQSRWFSSTFWGGRQSTIFKYNLIKSLNWSDVLPYIMFCHAMHPIPSWHSITHTCFCGVWWQWAWTTMWSAMSSTCSAHPRTICVWIGLRPLWDLSLVPPSLFRHCPHTVPSRFD